MSDMETEAQTEGLVLEYELDAPPEKVWRAISIPAFRESWLPTGALANAESVSSVLGQEVRYRMRDGGPPFLDSVVTLQIRPNAEGGTTLRIVHDLADDRLKSWPSAANDDGSPVMRAA